MQRVVRKLSETDLEIFAIDEILEVTSSVRIENLNGKSQKLGTVDNIAFTESES